MAWAVAINLIFAGVLGLTFPPMVAAMGQIGAFCFYAGLNALAFVGIFCLVPETKQFTLGAQRSPTSPVTPCLMLT
jgi:hypothetical protein